MSFIYYYIYFVITDCRQINIRYNLAKPTTPLGVRSFLKKKKL